MSQSFQADDIRCFSYLSILRKENGQGLYKREVRRQKAGDRRKKFGDKKHGVTTYDFSFFQCGLKSAANNFIFHFSFLILYFT